MLHLIGLGLELEDISLKAINAIKQCKTIYLESYTSTGARVKDLEDLIKKKVIIAEREIIENKQDEILKEAKKDDVAILVYGDPLIATTHINYIIDARKINVKVNVVHNVSIMNAITETGLMLYNFGKTTSIPFNNESVITPINTIKDNLKLGLHSLILLDLNPKNNKFLSANEALEYLMRNGIKNDCIACISLGTNKQEIKYGKINELINKKFDKSPQCIIIPGNLHFREKEALELWK